ncbi:hypothetical protein C0J52_01710 [Blattella germanica]|nr:hypothetical protein C0J52_01710 [Blattella germanica]
MDDQCESLTRPQMESRQYEERMSHRHAQGRQNTEAYTMGSAPAHNRTSNNHGKQATRTFSFAHLSSQLDKGKLNQVGVHRMD